METSFLRRASTFFISQRNLFNPNKEFLLLVQFHWKKVSWWRSVMENDQPSMPPFLMPYLHAKNWQLFLHAVERLAARNHFVGTIYVLLGLLALIAGFSYILYGVIPMGGYKKFASVEIALGSGIALLIAGICLFVWGKANRAGGVVFHSDLESICENMSHQVQGITVHFRSAPGLQQKPNNPAEVDTTKQLIFGIELFWTQDETEDSTSYPAYAAVGSDEVLMGGKSEELAMLPEDTA